MLDLWLYISVMFGCLQVFCKGFLRFLLFLFLRFSEQFRWALSADYGIVGLQNKQGQLAQKEKKMANEPDAKTQITEFIKDLDKSISRASATEMLKLYDENFEIKFLGKTVLIPFDAVSYNAIEDALKTIAAEL